MRGKEGLAGAFMIGAEEGEEYEGTGFGAGAETGAAEWETEAFFETGAADFLSFLLLEECDIK